jgi:DNA-binding response OmpR family regulator
MKNYKVLIGEDNLPIARYLMKILKENGYDANYSSTPEGVLKKIADCDLLLTDQNYGKNKNTGTDLIRKIRGSSIKNLPIILASSNIPLGLAKVCSELDVKTVMKKDFLKKEFENDLVEKVKTLLEK